MLIMNSKGLYCPAGNFYIDPKGAAENAVITHAHSDHARKGSKNYYCTTLGVSLLKARLGKDISVQAVPYRQKFMLGAVEVSFHPAGHILGSAQIRLEFAGEVWVVSGDYKRDPDPTCEPFEIVPCDVFITEATFGTPRFCWAKNVDLGKEIFEWWSGNAAQGINSVLFAYSLGKTQRILSLLKPFASNHIYCDSAATELNACYQAENVELAPTVCLSTVKTQQILQGDLILVPPSFLETEKAKILGNRFRTAFASGWMARNDNRFDRGFIMSDHADWNDLLRTIQETKAKRIYVQHRGKGALIKQLTKMGLQAFPDSDLFPKNPAQLVLF